MDDFLVADSEVQEVQQTDQPRITFDLLLKKLHGFGVSAGLALGVLSDFVFDAAGAIFFYSSLI